MLHFFIKKEVSQLSKCAEDLQIMLNTDLANAENYQQNISGVIFGCDSVSVLRFRNSNTQDNLKNFFW